MASDRRDGAEGSDVINIFIMEHLDFLQTYLKIFSKALKPIYLNTIN